MSKFLLQAQKLVFDTLNGNVSAGVYDDVPDQPPGKPEQDMPYVVITGDVADSWDTDSWVGERCTIELHVWSAYQGKKECKEIMAEIYALLHRQSLSAHVRFIPVGSTELLTSSGDTFTVLLEVSVVDCLQTFSTIPNVGASNYVHGICRYQLTITEV